MDEVLEIVERSNQRGGRMLSVIDLIEAGTLTPAQTCWLLSRIERGASWLVGARPGGAGKTAVMNALLTMLPEGETVRLANPGSGWELSKPGECVVAYEISPGRYDGYIWGPPVRRFAGLGKLGCRLVTNLHADTLEEARSQLVGDNGVPEEHFGAFGIFLPIRVSGGVFSACRRIEAIDYYDGGEWQPLPVKREPSRRERAILGFLDECLRKRVRTVAAVRRAWLEWRRRSSDDVPEGR